MEFMNNRRVWTACGVLLLALAALRMNSWAQEDLDSIKVCRDTQKVVFENTFVRVIDDVIPPGVFEPRHRHPHGLVIVLAEAQTETRTSPESPWRNGLSKFGAVTWSEPTVHEVHNVGQSPTHFIRIDVKTP